MRTKRSCVHWFCIALAAIPVFCNVVNGHDGGFGHSRRTIFLDAAPVGFILEYRITRSSDEALLEMTLIDTDGDGQISSEEKQAYFRTLGNELAKRFEVQTSSGSRVLVRLADWQLQPNLVQSFRYALPTMASEIRFVDRNFSHKPGVAKIIAGGLAKVEVAEPIDLNHAEMIALKVTRAGK